MGILELLMALPKILSAAKGFLDLLQNHFGPNFDEEIKKLNDAYGKLKDAKNDQERDDAIMALNRFRNRK